MHQRVSHQGPDMPVSQIGGMKRCGFYPASQTRGRQDRSQNHGQGMDAY